MGSLSRTRLSDFTFTFDFHALEKEMATPSSVLAWRIPGSLVGCRLWGHAESGTTEATQQQQQHKLGSPLPCGRLPAAASLTAEYRRWDAQAPGAVVQGLQGPGSCGSWARAHRLNSCSAKAYLLHDIQDLPRPGIKLVSPGLAGRFLTTEPPGKPRKCSCLSGSAQLCWTVTDSSHNPPSSSPTPSLRSQEPQIKACTFPLCFCLGIYFLY